jgi:nucleotide-binding universal stress UspA family protein
MRWMIGLDLEPRSHGAVELAGWLRVEVQPPAVQDFVAVHVLDERLHRLLRTDQLKDVFARAGQELDAFLDASNAAPAVISRRIVGAESPERGLGDLLATEPCDAVLIGRIAERDTRRLVRLGRVARRLLRRLPTPVVVVPPDLSSTTVGRGPLVLASDLGASSTAAAAFAQRLATELGRELVVVHVDAGFQVIPTFWGEPVVVPAPPRRIPADVDDWAESVGLRAGRTRLGEGSVVENVLDIAKLEDAPLIVCGSRGLDAVDRIFVSSTGMELARLADRPVAVVPSH